MKKILIALAVTLSGCSAYDRALTRYEEWPHSLMPRSIRSDAAPFDPYALGFEGHPVLNTFPTGG